MENKLIELYLVICRLYHTEAVLKHQRLSNFRPRCTDEELLTMYLFGHLQGHTTQRRIYDYFQNHWQEWFPNVPSYQAFNRRVNELAPAFELLITQHLRLAGTQIEAGTDRLLDSMPIMLAVGRRANRARFAHEIADTGFCAPSANSLSRREVASDCRAPPEVLTIAGTLRMVARLPT